MFKLGEWVVYTDDGLFIRETDGKASYPTKKAALKSILESCIDDRFIPKVNKIVSGVYIYRPKNPETQEFGQEYCIKKIKKHNLEEIQELYEYTISHTQEGDNEQDEN